MLRLGAHARKGKCSAFFVSECGDIDKPALLFWISLLLISEMFFQELIRAQKINTEYKISHITTKRVRVKYNRLRVKRNIILLWCLQIAI